jgi:hypothetical protein
MQSWPYSFMIACPLAVMAVTASARDKIRQCSLFNEDRMHAWLYALTISCTHDCMHSWLHVRVHMTVFAHECMHPWLHAPWLMHSGTACALDGVQSPMHVAMTACTLYCMQTCTHDCMYSWLDKFNRQKQYLIKIRLYHYKQDTIGIHEFEKYYPEKIFTKVHALMTAWLLDLKN